MAMQSTDTSALQRPRSNGFFGWLGKGLNAYMNARTRQAEIAALEAKSDEELAKMGLSRDRIVHHVFRDMIWA